MTTEKKPDENFDSGPETKAHIRRVNELLEFPINALIERAHVHDDSKLLPPEKELVPCDHPGCLSHIKHPCEGIGLFPRLACRKFATLTTPVSLN